MLKELEEKRAELQTEMEQILAKAKEEKRAINDEESARFDEIEKEIGSIDKTMAAEKRATELAADKKVEEEVMQTEQRAEQNEVRAFEAYLRGEEVRGTDMVKTDNGAVIPSSIANKIIDKIVEMSPLFKDSDRYNVKGTLNIPYWDESTDHITVDYATEFSAADSHTGKFASISLTGFLASALVDISKSLINNSQFDIVNFVINKMAEQIAAWIEGQLLYGTNQKIEGLAGGITQNDSTAATNKVTIDELIGLQEMVPDAYQSNAYWIMNKKTRTMIRQLKDGDGNYLLNRDLNARWGYTLLGKDVYCSDNMLELKAANAGKYCIFYGDMTGLATKVSEDVNIEVLREVKAAQHVVEVIGFVELDAKVQNAQKVAGLKVKA